MIIHNYSKFTKIPPSSNSVCFENPGQANCFGPKRNHYLFWCSPQRAFQHIGPKITKVHSFPNFILWFVVDIGTMLAEFHSCFLIHIGLISKIFEILFNDSSSCFGARLFEHFQTFGNPECRDM